MTFDLKHVKRIMLENMRRGEEEYRKKEELIVAQAARIAELEAALKRTESLNYKVLKLQMPDTYPELGVQYVAVIGLVRAALDTARAALEMKND